MSTSSASVIRAAESASRSNPKGTFAVPFLLGSESNRSPFLLLPSNVVRFDSDPLRGFLLSGTALAAAGATAGPESLFPGGVLSAQPELKQHPAGAEQDEAEKGEEVGQHGVWWLLLCRITIWAKG